MNKIIYNGEINENLNDFIVANNIKNKKIEKKEKTSVQIHRECVKEIINNMNNKLTDKDIMMKLNLKPCEIHKYKISNHCRKCKDSNIKVKEYKSNNCNIINSKISNDYKNFVGIPLSIFGNRDNYNINEIIIQKIKSNKKYDKYSKLNYSDLLIKINKYNSLCLELYVNNSEVISIFYIFLYLLCNLKLDYLQLKQLFEHKNNTIKILGLFYTRLVLNPTYYIGIIFDLFIRNINIYDYVNISKNENIQIVELIKEIIINSEFNSFRLLKIPFCIEREIEKEILKLKERKERLLYNISNKDLFKKGIKILFYYNNIWLPGIISAIHNTENNIYEVIYDYKNTNSDNYTFLSSIKDITEELKNKKIKINIENIEIIK